MHGGALRGELHRGRVHQVQDDVDVVDHEIHDHGVVLHPGHEGPEAARLDENGLLHDLAELRDGAVEALHVADVEHPPVLACHAEEFFGLLQRRGHRFLHEHAIHQFVQAFLSPGIDEYIRFCGGPRSRMATDALQRYVA